MIWLSIAWILSLLPANWEAVNANRKGRGGSRGARRASAREGRGQRVLLKALRREDRRHRAMMLPFSSTHAEGLYHEAAGLRRRVTSRVAGMSGTGIKRVKWSRTDGGAVGV